MNSKKANKNERDTTRVAELKNRVLSPENLLEVLLAEDALECLTAFLEAKLLVRITTNELEERLRAAFQVEQKK